MAADSSLTKLLESGVRSDPYETDYWCLLPDEVKLRILHYVDSQTIRQSVALVNKDLYNLSKDRSLYQRYETPEFDRTGFKSLAELNHPLYKSHLKALCTNSTCLKELDLQQFQSLQKVIVSSVSNACFSFNHSNLPPNLTSIEVRDVVNTCSPVDFTEGLLQGSVSVTVDVLNITREANLGEMLNISASQYVIAGDIVSSDEGLHSLLGGDLHYLLEMKNVRFSICDGTNLLSHVPDRLGLIILDLDCSDEEHRQTILSVCRNCSSLENLSLSLKNVNEFPTIESVTSTQLKTVILENSDQTSGVDITKRCERILSITRQSLILTEFHDIPFDMLDYVSPSLSLLLFTRCDWCSESENVDQRKQLKSLTLANTPAAPILDRIDPCITRLSLHSCKDNCSDTVFSALELMTCLEFFSVSHSTITVHSVLESLLPSKNSLLVFKAFSSAEPDIDVRQTLQLLQQFKRLQYFEANGYMEFATKQEITEFFPTAIVDAPPMQFDFYQIRIYF